MNVFASTSKRFAALKIGTQLSLAFFMLLMLTVVIGGFSILKLAEVNTVSSNLAHKWMPRIGLTTTMFSIVNGAVLRGLPFPESDRILHIAPFDVAEQDDIDTWAHTYAELSRRQQSFDELAAFAAWRQAAADDAADASAGPVRVLAPAPARRCARDAHP